ncbi:MAG: GAF domain-containing protein, partial [Flavisolibacter sp.]
SYRENEITLNTNFSLTVEEINRKGIEVQKILLTPLSYKNVEKLIYEALFHPVQNDEALIRLIYDKSEGNPFFINAFVKSLFIENIISFDYYSFKWEWNSEHINRLKFTENIIGLMTERIQKLSPHAQRLLKIAACIGFSFDISLLNIILNKNADEIKELLKPALDEGLCMIIGDTFRFLHDRIQQAAYSLIPESIKNDEHLKIGNTLLQSLTTKERNKYIFEIVNQLNAGSESIMSRQEKDILAALNLTVGIKARNSAAYKPSFEYLQTGIRLLDENAWKLHYDLALQLYTIGAESAFLSGNTDQMNEWIETVIQNASGVLDKVKVYEIMMKWYNSQHRLIDSVQTCLKILELLNVRFPKKPKKVHVLYAFLKTKIVLLRRRPEDLENLRLIKDPYAEAAIRLLSSIGAAFFFARPDLFPLITTKNFLLMVRYGNSSYSSAVIAGLGLLTIAGEKNIEKGYRLGKVAVKVSEKFEANSFKYQCMMMVNNFIFHWKEHLENILEPLRLNYWHCLETGNTEFASYSAGLYSCNAFFCGKNLKELTKEMLRFNEDIRQLRQEIALNIQLILTQTVLNLQEPCDDPVLLTGKEHNEEEMMKLYKKTKAESLLFYVHFNKLILSYLFGKYDEAYINACEARNRLISVPGSSRVTIFYLYETLTLIAVCNKYTNKQNKVIKTRIQKNLRTFRKFNHFAPMNCSHKLLLIEAEGNRVTGNTAKAGEQYDKAIEECKKNRYLNDLALIHELAGKFYESQGRNFIAKQYLIQAHKLFQEWGALAKVKDIEQNHPFLFEEIQMAVLNPQLTNDVKEQNSASNLNTTLEELDLHSILRASTAISSEIQLDKLIKKLVKIAVENTGAQNGYLILKKQNGFYIEAEGSIDKEEEEIIIQSIPLSGNQSVSEAIIQFVYVTQENLVLDNATDHPNFSSDPIILKNGSKSVLCTPIIHQGSVIGLLYFENRLINNAFTPDRIEIVKLLSGQMAISLQNALNEQKKMNAFIEQEKLLKQINHHQKELLNTKLEIQEQTYHNISEEIHDNIGQALSLIKININTIDLNNPELAKDKLSESKNLLTKVIQDLRDLSKLLNTDFIEKTGLSNAIDQQLQLLNKTGLYSASLHLNGVVSKFESNRELVIFRIVQELLNNVVKHANASMIKITMDYQVNKLVITVEDNGKGFDAQIQLIEENKGLGLRNIFNRISFIKGTIDIKSEPDRGTVVVIDLPK